MNGINKRIRDAGVVWHLCGTCGRDWPFPTGADPMEAREFRCQICMNAVTAAHQRQLTALVPIAILNHPLLLERSAVLAVFEGG